MRPAAKVISNLVVTLVQAAVAWSLLHYLIPLAIVRWQQREELHHIGLDALPMPGLALFAAATAANLWSRLTLAWFGGGVAVAFTPPPNLVTVGPYAWLRNPMMSTAVAQGVGVIAYTGSALLVPYYLALALGWQLLIRPTEDHELQRRFGREFEFYQRSVRLWLPMRRRFQPRRAVAPIATDEVLVRAGRRRRR